MKHWCLVVPILILAAAAVFSPVLDNGFTNWDDNIYLTENHLVRQLSWHSAKSTFISFVSGNYHPLVFLSYAVEYHFAGLDPRVYHATNLLLHLANSLLVFFIFRLLGAGIFSALAGALFFSLHPQRVEPVAWVAGRKDLLCAFFFFASLAAYLRYRRGSSSGLFILALLLFLLSLLSKATAVTLPVVLILCDFLERRGFSRRALAEKVPFFALALLFGIVALQARQSFQDVLREGGYGAVETLSAGVQRIAFTYGTRTVWPLWGEQSLYPDLSGRVLTSPGFLLAALVIAAVAGAAGFSVRRTRTAAFGFLFFAATLAPSLSVTVLGASADRFAYIPSFGLAFLFGEGLAWVLGEGMSRSRIRQAAALGLLLVVTVFFGLLSHRGSKNWKDSVALWTATLKRFPGGPATAQNRAFAFTYRGLALRADGEHRRALEDFGQALDLYPRSEAILTHRARTLMEIGEHGAALRDLDRAVDINGSHAPARMNRGIVYRIMGRTGEALAEFTAAVEINPAYAAAYNERGITYGSGGDHVRALEDFAYALKIDPGNSKTYANRGITRGALGDDEGALDDFERAISLDGANPGAFLARGEFLAGRGRREEALGDLHRAVELDPRNAAALAFRAKVLAESGRRGEALKDAQGALRLGYPLEEAFPGMLQELSSPGAGVPSPQSEIGGSH